VTTSSDPRAALLVRALGAGLRSDPDELSELYTADVSGSSPTRRVSSLAELACELRTYADAFSDIEIVADAGVSGDLGYVEWEFTAVHTGDLVVDDEIVIPPTGCPVTLRGVTVAEFSGERIAAFRQYWDEPALLEGLGLIPVD
jgi:SnoaL-like polyketide cyclase